MRPVTTPGVTPCVHFCPPCGCDAIVFPFGYAARLLSVPDTILAQLAGSGTVHLVTTDDGEARVCAASIHALGRFPS